MHVFSSLFSGQISIPMPHPVKVRGSTNNVKQVRGGRDSYV
jgi:hypothetical protein